MWQTSQYSCCRQNWSQPWMGVAEEQAVTWPFQGNRRVQPGAPAALGLSSTSASHPGLAWDIRSVGLTPFSPAAIKTNGVSFHSCPKRGTVGIQSLLHVVIWSWEHLMVTIYKVCIFKAISLHVADAINSTAGGWEQWGIVGWGEESQTKRVISFRTLSAFIVDLSA